MEKSRLYYPTSRLPEFFRTVGSSASWCRPDFVIDIDHLASVEEAAMWRDRLFTDEVLQPDLAFVSPGAKGVKLFVPYRLNLTDTLEHSFDNALHTAWDYLGWRHGLKADTANADMSRACFLAYDEEAKCKI